MKRDGQLTIPGLVEPVVEPRRSVHGLYRDPETGASQWYWIGIFTAEEERTLAGRYPEFEEIRPANIEELFHE